MKYLGPPQSGSQAESTYSRNRFGQYTRNRSTPVQPRSDLQVAARVLLTTLSQQWQRLTDAQRSAWNTYAAATPFQDSLGQTYFRTGHQTYVSINAAFTTATLPTQDDPPSLSPPAPADFSIDTIAAPDTVDLTVGNTLDTTAALVVFGSPIVSAGVSFMGDFRFIGAYKAKVMGIVSVGPDYVAKYGNLVSGRKFFLDVFHTIVDKGPSIRTRVAVPIP